MKGTLGAEHGGVLGPNGSEGLHHATFLYFRGLDTKSELSISKSLAFMARGCFWDRGFDTKNVPSI